MSIIFIDPPSGWQYGFPKQLPPEIDVNDDKAFEDWLRAEGYPEAMMDLALKYCRYWIEDDNNNERETCT